MPYIRLNNQTGGLLAIYMERFRAQFESKCALRSARARYEFPEVWASQLRVHEVLRDPYLLFPRRPKEEVRR